MDSMRALTALASLLPSGSSPFRRCACVVSTVGLGLPYAPPRSVPPLESSLRRAEVRCTHRNEPTLRRVPPADRVRTYLRSPLFQAQGRTSFSYFPETRTESNSTWRHSFQSASGPACRRACLLACLRCRTAKVLRPCAKAEERLLPGRAARVALSACRRVASPLTVGWIPPYVGTKMRDRTERICKSAAGSTEEALCLSPRDRR